MVIINNNEIIEMISNVAFIQIASNTRKVRIDAINKLAKPRMVLNSANIPCLFSAHLFILLICNNKYIIVKM